MITVVTGAGGLLGSECVLLLAAAPDQEVIALSTQPEDVLHQKWGLNPESSPINVVHPQQYFDSPRFWGRPNAVINCAWPLNLGGQQLAAGLDYHVALFNATRISQADVMVNASSQSVYNSQRDYAATETSELDLDGPYAAAKYAVELMSKELCRPTPTIQARISSLVHPDFHRRLVNKMTRRAMDEGIVTIAQPHQVYDFMDARDTAQALIRLATLAPTLHEPTVNIGSSDPRTLESIGRLVAESVTRATGRPVSIEYGEQASKPFSSALDCTMLNTKWNFQSVYSIQDTISSVIEQHDSHPR